MNLHDKSTILTNEFDIYANLIQLVYGEIKQYERTGFLAVDYRDELRRRYYDLDVCKMIRICKKNQIDYKPLVEYIVE